MAGSWDRTFRSQALSCLSPFPFLAMSSQFPCLSSSSVTCSPSNSALFSLGQSSTLRARPSPSLDLPIFSLVFCSLFEEALFNLGRPFIFTVSVLNLHPGCGPPTPLPCFFKSRCLFPSVSFLTLHPVLSPWSASIFVLSLKLTPSASGSCFTI